jgi:hypothetical protein
VTTLGDPQEGGGPAASPAQAQTWIRAWQSIDGGITIGVDQTVNPWRLTKGGADPQDHIQRLLLQELDERPGLKAAVRVIMGTEARQQADRALRAMGRKGLSDDD